MKTEGQDIFLELCLKKGNFQEDEECFYFDTEASNENLDFEQQVLQRALLDSKEYFLSNGVVSKDHLHQKLRDGRVVFDESYVIGEPVAVYTEGNSTRVRGKLYKSNENAKGFIDLLRAGSSRVKASVGGILPKVVKNIKDGTSKVVSVLWNDLALTNSAGELDGIAGCGGAGEVHEQFGVCEVPGCGVRDGLGGFYRWAGARPGGCGGRRGYGGGHSESDWGCGGW
jgi:hypothetical protein